MKWQEKNFDDYEKKSGVAQGTFFVLPLVHALIQHNGKAIFAAPGIWQTETFRGKDTKASLEAFKK